MSVIQNYQKVKFAQINLDDGNKILLSYGAADMRVFRLGFMSLSKETIHIFNTNFICELNNKIGYDLSKDIVKILADELAKVKSLDEVKKNCLALEKDKNFLNKI